MKIGDLVELDTNLNTNLKGEPYYGIIFDVSILTGNVRVRWQDGGTSMYIPQGRLKVLSEAG